MSRIIASESSVNSRIGDGILDGVALTVNGSLETYLVPNGH